jgi:hypothetical protein
MYALAQYIDCLLTDAMFLYAALTNPLIIRTSCNQVTSGWSHVGARGVRANGDTVITIWGRRDLGQYPYYEGNLSPLPNGLAMSNVWCGSEFTIVSDAVGGLWSAGWNEHGTLGTGRAATTFAVHRSGGTDWTAVRDTSGAHVTLTCTYDFVLDCGGGHVICLQ